MICTDTARDLIKDPSLTGELHAYIRDARDQYGMQTFDQHLVVLVADSPSRVAVALDGLRRLMAERLGPSRRLWGSTARASTSGSGLNVFGFWVGFESVPSDPRLTNNIGNLGIRLAA